MSIDGKELANVEMGKCGNVGISKCVFCGTASFFLPLTPNFSPYGRKTVGSPKGDLVNTNGRFAVNKPPLGGWG